MGMAKMHLNKVAQAVSVAREMGRKSGGGGDDPEGLEAKSLIEALEKRDEQIKQFCEKAAAEIKAVGKTSDETRVQLEEAAKKGVELQERLAQLERKLARRGQTQPEKQKSWGETVVASEGFKSLAEGKSARTGRLQVKAITSAADSAGANVVAMRVPGVVAQPDRVLTIRDLVMPGRTTSNSVEFVREGGFTNAAAAVAEGALKPESALTFDLATANVRTLAHWVPASKQILDDAPQLASYIDGRMRVGVQLKEEVQLLTGDGTGQNLHGLIPQATPYQVARTLAGDTVIDVVRHAITQVRVAEYAASAIVLHPNDWERIELTKTDDNAYVFANPANTTQPRLWGLPVVETTAMAEGEFLVGAFNIAAQIFDREETTVEVSTEDRDNFVKNMVTIRAEERLAFCIYRPEAFVHGEFPAPAAP